MKDTKDQIRLQIKREFLDKILSGEKTVEYRDVTDYYIDRLCVMKDDGEEIDYFKPIKTVEFVCGYKKEAFKAVYQIEKIALEEWLDEQGNYKEEPDFTFAIYLGQRIS